jgi:hypothetical protein
MHPSFQHRPPDGVIRPLPSSSMKLAHGRELAHPTGPTIGGATPHLLAKLDKGD